eukprot:scaffold533_cov369-Prasinococcus_capsulatus_cf.AAC.26
MDGSARRASQRARERARARPIGRSVGAPAAPRRGGGGAGASPAPGVWRGGSGLVPSAAERRARSIRPAAGASGGRSRGRCGGAPRVTSARKHLLADWEGVAGACGKCVAGSGLSWFLVCSGRGPTAESMADGGRGRFGERDAPSFVRDDFIVPDVVKTVSRHWRRNPCSCALGEVDRFSLVGGG